MTHGTAATTRTVTAAARTGPRAGRARAAAAGRRRAAAAAPAAARPAPSRPASCTARPPASAHTLSSLHLSVSRVPQPCQLVHSAAPKSAAGLATCTGRRPVATRPTPSTAAASIALGAPRRASTPCTAPSSPRSPSRRPRRRARGAAGAPRRTRPHLARPARRRTTCSPFTRTGRRSGPPRTLRGRTSTTRRRRPTARRARRPIHLTVPHTACHRRARATRLRLGSLPDRCTAVRAVVLHSEPLPGPTRRSGGDERVSPHARAGDPRPEYNHSINP